MSMLSPAQVADRLGIDRSTVLRWAADGRLPAARLSDRVLRVSEEQLDEFVKERIVGEAAR